MREARRRLLREPIEVTYTVLPEYAPDTPPAVPGIGCVATNPLPTYLVGVSCAFGAQTTAMATASNGMSLWGECEMRHSRTPMNDRIRGRNTRARAHRAMLCEQPSATAWNVTLVESVAMHMCAPVASWKNRPNSCNHQNMQQQWQWECSRPRLAVNNSSVEFPRTA